MKQKQSLKTASELVGFCEREIIPELFDKINSKCSSCGLCREWKWSSSGRGLAPSQSAARVRRGALQLVAGTEIARDRAPPSNSHLLLPK